MIRTVVQVLSALTIALGVGLLVGGSSFDPALAVKPSKIRASITSVQIAFVRT